MTFSIGDAPFLRRKSLQGLVELNKASMYESGFPIQQLFGMPRLVDAETVQIETTQADRSSGTLHSQPADHDPVVTSGAGFKLASTLFQQYCYKIPSNESAKMRMPGETADQAGPGFNASAAAISAAHRRTAEARVAGKIGSMSNKVMREWEIWAANLISTVSFTQTIDDVAQTVTTLIKVIDASASWATASTDIPADLALFMKEFVDQSGGMPTHMIYSFQLWEDLGKNDAVRAVVNPVAGRIPITGLPLDILPGQLRDTTQLVSTAHYTNAAGTKTYYWPHYVMTWIRLQPGEKILDFIYSPNARNNYGASPALNGRVYVDPKSMIEEVLVEANGAPVVLNEDQIMMFDLTTTALP